MCNRHALVAAVTQIERRYIDGAIKDKRVLLRAVMCRQLQ